MSTLWKQILTGKGESYSSTAIQGEIKRLESLGQKMKADLIERSSSLGGLQQNLLEELPGARDAVRSTESNISELQNKGAATATVIKDLKIKLNEALANEQARRQSEITGEIAVLDEQIAKTRLLIVEHFAKAAALYGSITGQEPTKFSFDFVFNNRLIDVFSKRIAEIEANEQGASLFHKRRTLSAEADRLGRG